MTARREVVDRLADVGGWLMGARCVTWMVRVAAVLVLVAVATQLARWT